MINILSILFKVKMKSNTLTEEHHKRPLTLRIFQPIILMQHKRVIFQNQQILILLGKQYQNKWD